MGCTFSTNGRFNENSKILAQKGLKALFKLTKSFEGDWPSFATSMHLFNSMIKPILSYSADACALYSGGEEDINFDKILKSSIEKVHQRFLKYAIGLNKHTVLISLYGETGMFPIVLEQINSALYFTSRLQRMPENSLLKKCYEESKLNLMKNSHQSNLNHIMKNNTNISRAQINQVLAYNKQSFISFWRSKLHDDSKNINGNKLRHYRSFKSNFCREKYLDILEYKPLRSKLAALRLSSHSLNIEMGRRVPFNLRLPPKERLCNKCELQICENEFHFTLECPFYKELRSKLLKELKERFHMLSEYDISQTYVWLITNNDDFVIRKFAKYIHECFRLR